MLERRNLPPRRIDKPEPGYFLVRLTRGGPLVAAQITFARGLWGAAINGKMCGDQSEDPMAADGVMRVWLGTPIDYTEYLRRLGHAADPTHPASTPRRPVDLTKIPPPF